MEILLHFIYVVALKDAKAWRGLGPGELAVVGFWNLIIVWLKVSSNNLPFLDGEKRNEELSVLPFHLRLDASSTAAPHPLAILPTLGSVGRDGPS